MNIVLWALQIALAAKFISATVTHGLCPDYTKMQSGLQRFRAATRRLLLLIALATSLGGLGLILSAATGTLTCLTPWSAALLGVMRRAEPGTRAGFPGRRCVSQEASRVLLAFLEGQPGGGLVCLGDPLREAGGLAVASRG